MATFGVSVAVIQNGQILLTQRSDFPIWVLPGGAVDDGESLAQAFDRREAQSNRVPGHLTLLKDGWGVGGFEQRGRNLLVWDIVMNYARACRESEVHDGPTGFSCLSSLAPSRHWNRCYLRVASCPPSNHCCLSPGGTTGQRRRPVAHTP